MSEEQNQAPDNNQDAWENQEPFNSKVSFDETRVQGQEGNPTLYNIVATRSFIVVFLGLLVTTLASFIMYKNVDAMDALLSGYTFTILLVLEMVLVLVNGVAIKKDQLVLAAVLFVAYSIINGVTLSVVFLAYTAGSVKGAFLTAGLVFGVMAAVGYFTKKDLSSLGSICTMALIGVILVSVLNGLILKSGGLDLIMDYVVVLLFVGITAYDMNRMKKMTDFSGEAEINKIALYTGMQLYLDFINLFLRILRIMGKRR